MLGERVTLKIGIDNKVCQLKLNMRFIKNLFMLTNENPFEIINKLIKNDKSDSNCFYHIIMAMTNLELDIEDLINLSDNLDDVRNAIIGLISTEMLSEIIYDEEDDETSQQPKAEKKDVDLKRNFLEWYNYHYYMLVYNLKLSEEEFFELSIREAKTIVELHKQEFTNGILRAYIQVIKSQNKGSKNGSKAQRQDNGMVATKNNGIRIRDLLMAKQ